MNGTGGALLRYQKNAKLMSMLSFVSGGVFVCIYISYI